jgi:hypothetical protein
MNLLQISLNFKEIEAIFVIQSENYENLGKIKYFNRYASSFKAYKRNSGF